MKEPLKNRLTPQQKSLFSGNNLLDEIAIAVGPESVCVSGQRGILSPTLPMFLGAGVGYAPWRDGRSTGSEQRG